MLNTESIFHNIIMLPIHYSGSKEGVKPALSLIKSVESNLPQQVKDQIGTQCIIFLVGNTYGYSIGPIDRHIILLNIEKMNLDRLSTKEQQFVIAHEFAHVILGHEHSNKKEEQEANDLVLSWGFTPG